MLGSLLPITLTGLLQVTGVFAADDAPSCGLGNNCPKSAPCCSRESLHQTFFNHLGTPH